MFTMQKRDNNPLSTEFGQYISSKCWGTNDDDSLWRPMVPLDHNKVIHGATPSQLNE